MEEIDEIVKEAYKIFSGNKPGEYLDAGGLWAFERENALKLKSLPIRDIPLELLRSYHSSPKLRKLNLSELKYFAPRYLELIKDNEFPSFIEVLSLDRFGYFNESDWKTDERELLNRYALGVFRNYLKSEWKGSLLPHEMLLMFHKGNFKIDKLLKEWERTSEQESLIKFYMLLNNIEYTKYGKLEVTDAFSDKKFNDQICDWVRSKSVKVIFREKIQHALMNPGESFSRSYWEELSWRFEMMI